MRQTQGRRVDQLRRCRIGAKAGFEPAIDGSTFANMQKSGDLIVLAQVRQCGFPHGAGGQAFGGIRQPADFGIELKDRVSARLGLTGVTLRPPKPAIEDLALPYDPKR